MLTEPCTGEMDLVRGERKKTGKKSKNRGGIITANGIRRSAPESPSCGTGKKSRGPNQK